MHDNPLVSKLSGFLDLTSCERHEIETWCAQPKQLNARSTLIHEGDQTGATCLMLSGWAYRYKDIRGGKRQIVGFLLPGDMCDLHGFLHEADHSIAMLSNAEVALIPSEALRASTEKEPRLMRGLWWTTLVDAAIAREWILNVGLRDAAPRLASLFCELWLRAHRVGLAEDGAFLAPLTQTELGEALGLTSVHINRMLRILREQRLLEFRGKQVVIQDLKALMEFADYDPTYLQLTRRL